MSNRFYVNCPLTPGPVTLTGAEAHHLATVCRLRPGEPVCLFNGDGREYPAEVLEVGRRQVTLHVLRVETPRRELPFRLEVAAALPKGDRAQFLVEKLTELGVTTFVPLQTQHSVVHPREAKLEKLERWVIEASKQCGRNQLMSIEKLTEWEETIRRSDLPALRLVAHPGEAGEPWPAGQDVAVAVGPEGGFTEEEVDQARAAGWRRIGLGPRILRIETAAILLASWAARLPEPEA
jgi:16S rRNA (uracil1498-N3)-methyltransferase